MLGRIGSGSGSEGLNVLKEAFQLLLGLVHRLFFGLLLRLSLTASRLSQEIWVKSSH